MKGKKKYYQKGDGTKTVVQGGRIVGNLPSGRATKPISGEDLGSWKYESDTTEPVAASEYDSLHEAFLAAKANSGAAFGAEMEYDRDGNLTSSKPAGVRNTAMASDMRFAMITSDESQNDAPDPSISAKPEPLSQEYLDERAIFQVREERVPQELLAYTPEELVALARMNNPQRAPQALKPERIEKYREAYRECWDTLPADQQVPLTEDEMAELVYSQHRNDDASQICQVAAGLEAEERDRVVLGAFAYMYSLESEKRRDPRPFREFIDWELGYMSKRIRV